MKYNAMTVDDTCAYDMCNYDIRYNIEIFIQ